jgi:trans-aconitate methyltransferase
MGQFHFTPDRYLELMHSEVPQYERMQDEVAAACEGLEVRAILELGIGTGETARRVLQRHPGASLIGIDASEEMLVAAHRALAAHAVQLHAGRLEDALPPRPSYRCPGAFFGYIDTGTSRSSAVRRMRFCSAMCAAG